MRDYHYGKLQEAYSRQEMKMQRLVEQLQKSYEMHMRLQEGLEKVKSEMSN